MNKEKNEELIDFELDLKDVFIERHGAELNGKSLNEVIEAYVRWRHNRYTVIDQDGCFLVMDLYNQELPVAVIGKDLDPDAFNHAWNMAEDLNNLPEQYISIGNRILDGKFDFSTSGSLNITNAVNDALNKENEDE